MGIRVFIAGDAKLITELIASSTCIVSILSRKFLYITSVLLALCYPSAHAAVYNITPSDVTPRAASVIWASDEAVVNATVRVFSDPQGTNNITAGLTLSVVSAQVPFAHNNGIVKVDIQGLTPTTRIYIQTQTTSANGLMLFPPAPPYIEILTAAETTRLNPIGRPIVNDLIRYPLFTADGATPANGGIVLIQAVGVSAYPISAFVGQDSYLAPDTVTNMNNYFDMVGISVEVVGEQVLMVEEFRGRHCPAAQQRSIRYRRAPQHLENPPISKLQNANPCYFADAVCDGVVNALDAQYVMNVLGQGTGSCGFNPDLDVVQDGLINVLDGQHIMNNLGATVPPSTIQ